MFNIAVVYGGYSSEYEVSVKSGKFIYENLKDNSDWNVYEVCISNDKNFVKYNKNVYELDYKSFSFSVNGTVIKPNAVFNIIHGDPGENGDLAEILERNQIPQTACDVYVSKLTSNKKKYIDFVSSLGVPSSKQVLITRNEIDNISSLSSSIKFPCIVKPNNGGSSIGVSKVYKANELDEKVQIKLKDIRGMKANEGVDSLEMNMNMVISTRNKKDTLFYLNKIFAFPKIGLPEFIVKFATNLLTDEYDAKVTLSDINGPDKLNFTFPFEVNSFEPNKIKNKNLSIEGYYFSSLEDKTTILAPHSKLENGTYALFYGMDGFKVKKNKIYPGIAIRIEDEAGKEMFSFENALKTNKENGLELPLESNNISAYFELTDGQVNQKCTVFFTLYDFYSKGRITIKQEFN